MDLWGDDLWHCRLVCLRIHPVFKLDHPMATVVKYMAIDGTSHEISPNTNCQELWLRGSERPNGKAEVLLFEFYSCCPTWVWKLFCALECSKY